MKKNKNKVILWKKQIEELEKFARTKGSTVVIETTRDGISTFDPSTKEIEIHSQQSLENQFYHLIHEIGHLLIAKNYRKYQNTFGYAQKTFSTNSKVHKVSEIEEEFEAWKLGYQQAKKLRLYINNKNFEKIKAQNIISYFEWAVGSYIKRLIRKELIGEETSPPPTANKILTKINKKNSIIELIKQQRRRKKNGKQKNQKRKE